MYKTIFLPAGMYEYETPPASLRNKHGLTVYENRVVRRTQDGGSNTKTENRMIRRT
jgi:hypothetical protein